MPQVVGRRFDCLVGLLTGIGLATSMVKEWQGAVGSQLLRIVKELKALK